MNEVLADEADHDLRAADGRVPGRRGRATRQRLLECTAAMLGSTSYRDLKIIDIARQAGTSPATFYQYFGDVQAAILVLAEELTTKGAPLARLVDDADWRGEAAYDAALALVDGFLQFWDEHRSVLRVVDLAAEEGDQRFRQARVRFLAQVTDALAGAVRQAQGDGRQPADVAPRAVAGTLVSMLAHVAAHQFGFEFWGIRTRDLRIAMARQVHWAITREQPPH